MAATTQQRRHCGEVFMMNNYIMTVECTFCFEQYTAYDKFLNHIFDHHFDEVDRFTESQDELTEYDDENILKSLQMGEDDIQDECIDMLTDDAFKTNETSENKTSAEVNQLESIDEFYGDNVTTEITLCPSKIDSKETTQPNEITNLVQNSGTDSISLKYRPVVTNYHKITEGEDRKFKCRICGSTFAQLTILRKHEKRHSTNKPFPCTKCSKRFFTRTELDTHIRWHTGERPFVCTYCGSSFVTNSLLNIHERRHLDKRNYKCDECGKRFFDGRQLRVHAVVHSKERNYECEVCQAKFSRKLTLQTHMKLHENALRYECVICHMRFNQRPTMLWHVKSKHNLVRADAEGKGSAKAVNSIGNEN